MTVTLKDPKLWIAGYNLSGDHSQLELTTTKDTPESTVFGLDSRRYLADGLKMVAVSHAGMYDQDSTVTPLPVDDVLWAEHVGTALTVMTLAVVGAVGDVGYSFNAISSTYQPIGGSIGDAHVFTAAGQGTGDVVRGTIMEPGVTARSSSSNSSEFNLGDLAAGETGFAALHVIATTGSPTLDVDIESDATGFASPTTRISFVQATAVGAQFLSDSTVTADDFWRAAWTFGGTGSITFVVNFGIQLTG